MPIDTLKAARRLQEGNTFNEEQAERIAEVLSELDVASATREDLNEMEERLTARLDRGAEEQASLKERIGRLEKQIDEAVPTKSELEAVEERLGRKIEQKHTATIRTVVGSVAAVGAVLAVVIPLVIYYLG